MLRIFADHTHDARAVDDLALVANLFDGCPYFHVRFLFTYPVQLFPEQLYNPASSPVMRRDRHQNPVARPEPDKIRFRRPGHVRQDPVFIGEPQPE
jgi:hypothetical protein